MSINQWGIVFVLMVLSFMFSIPRKFYNTKTLVAIFTLPKAFFLMFMSLFKLKNANKRFIHTEHGVNNK